MKNSKLNREDIQNAALMAMRTCYINDVLYGHEMVRGYIRTSLRDDLSSTFSIGLAYMAGVAEGKKRERARRAAHSE